MSREIGMPGPEIRAREILARTDAALARAMLAVSPQDPAISALTFFPKPSEVRADDPRWKLSFKQEAGLRAAASELGIGRRVDTPISERFPQFNHPDVIIEGGQPHKIAAEAELVLSDSDARPRSIIFTASKERKITREDERESAKRQGITPGKGFSEYDVASSIAKSLFGFVPVVRETSSQIGYTFDEEHGYRLAEKNLGQMQKLGVAGNGWWRAPVYLMSIDRTYFTNEVGEEVYRQPSPVDIMRMIASTRGSLSVAYATSATYEPSRAIGAALACLASGKQNIGVVTYGTLRLAVVKDEDAPAPAPINQIPGELYKAAEEAERLRAALDAL